LGVGIEVSDLNAWYGTNHTLKDIQLNIPANHATALIGPSGCGKSTFVRCLNRMHETNPIARVTGKVLINDVDIYAEASPVEIRRRVGMVFQRPNPFPTMSIYDNVASGLKLNGFRSRRVLDEVVEEEVGCQPLRWSAAAALHCACPRRGSRGPADGRACVRARSRLDSKD
jgi:phosphate transport system ATP-binding protein